MRLPHRLALATLTLSMLAGTAAQADVMPPAARATLLAIPLVILAFTLVGTVLTFWCCVRLLHRTGHSGWWALLMFLPLINFIALLIWAFTPNGKRPINA